MKKVTKRGCPVAIVALSLHSTERFFLRIACHWGTLFSSFYRGRRGTTKLMRRVFLKRSTIVVIFQLLLLLFLLPQPVGKDKVLSRSVVQVSSRPLPLCLSSESLRAGMKAPRFPLYLVVSWSIFFKSSEHNGTDRSVHGHPGKHKQKNYNSYQNSIK